MMNKPQLLAWTAGAGIVLIAELIWLLTVLAETYPGWAVLLLWGSPVVAGAITAYFAPTAKIPIAISLCLVYAFGAVLTNNLVESAGHVVDFPGASGNLHLLILSLLVGFIGALVGATLGIFLARLK